MGLESDEREGRTMKYIMMCLTAAVLCFGIGAVLTMLLRKKSRHPYSWGKSVALSAVFGLLAMGLTSVGYLSIYYHADKDIPTLVSQNPQVQVQEIKGGYYIDGPGEDTAMVFYPGAKVDEQAYIPLMVRLAQEGMDCFIAKVPFHMAMFGSNRAGQFMEKYDYDTWITAGHSMGGIIAASYAAGHPDQISAVVLLASYPTSTIPESVRLCSLYGSNDRCLGMEAYEKARTLWSENSMEKCIEGGNHAQFGNYGPQKGDGPAEISAEKQQQITAEFIADCLLEK